MLGGNWSVLQCLSYVDHDCHSSWGYSLIRWHELIRLRTLFSLRLNYILRPLTNYTLPPTTRTNWIARAPSRRWTHDSGLIAWSTGITWPTPMAVPCMLLWLASSMLFWLTKFLLLF